jgi:hypothetical protein
MNEVGTMNEMEQPADIQQVQAAPARGTRSVIRVDTLPPQVQAAMTRTERFAELSDLAKDIRLHKALMDKLNIE